jgi:NADH-quinone oxidoreductase subunit K
MILINNLFLFCFGLFGIILNQKNIIIILMSIELLLLSINLNYLYLSMYMDDLSGQLFSLVIITVAASESAIGLALLILFFLKNDTISILKTNSLSL